MYIQQISNYKNSNFKIPNVTNPLYSGVIRYPYQVMGNDSVTFTGEDLPEEIIENKLYEARQVSGIHCPVCGVKMFSKKDFKNFVENSKNINNSKQLLDIINKDIEFVPVAFRRIVHDSKRIPDYKNLGVKDYIIGLREVVAGESIRSVKIFKDSAVKYADNVPEEFKEEYLGMVDSIDPNDDYMAVTKKIKNFAEQTNIDKSYIDGLRWDLARNIDLTKKYYEMLNIDNLENIDDSEAAQIFIHNLFRLSKNHMNKIERYEYFLDNPNNKILLCGNCEPHHKLERKVFFKDKNQPDLKNNVTLYLKDLSFLNGTNIIDIPNNYLAYVCFRVSALSGKTINFQPNDLQRIYKAQNVMSRHDKFLPIIQTETDIPCAECGTILMPHTVKLKVIEDLNKCQTPYDYAEVLNKYQKYQGLYSRKLIEIFTSIVDEEPYITNDKFIEKFNCCADNYLKVGLYHVIADYKNSRSIYENKGRDRIGVFDKVYRRTKRYVDKGKYDNFVFGDYYKAVLEDIPLTDFHIKAISNMLRQFKIISYKHDMAFPYSPVYQSSKQKINSIVYNLLMSDLATADHLIASDKGGDGSKYNLIALCKGCNKLKTNKSVVAWCYQHPGVKRNFLKQLLIIDEMSKNGELEGYEDWAKIISETVYSETDGKFDYRDNF